MASPGTQTQTTTPPGPQNGGARPAAPAGPPAAKRRFNPRVLLLVALLVIIGTFTWNWWQERQLTLGPPQGSGTVEANQIEVGPQVGARILRLYVDEGDSVKKGQVIARLDDVSLRANLETAIGNRDAAANRLRDLRQGSRSQQVAAARATLVQAEAAATGAQQSLSDAELGFSHSTDTKQAVDAARAQVAALTAQYAAAQRTAAALGAQVAGAGQTLATAQTGLNSVTDLQQVLDAARGQLDTARASRDRAETALSTSRADFERVSSLYNQGAVAKRDFDAAQLALTTAQTGLDTANSQVTTAQAGVQNAQRALNERLAARQSVITAGTSRNSLSRQRDAAQQTVRQVAAQLEGARQALVNAEVSYADRIPSRTARDAAATQAATSRAQADAARQNLALLEAGNTQASIAAAQGQLTAAEGQVAAAKKQLVEAVVVAPSDGVVSTVVARAGETVSAGLPIIEMQDLKDAYVRVYLPFRAFGKVKVGDTATITTDAIPGQTYQGKVLETASQAEFTPKNVETRDQRIQQVYAVKVGISNADGRLKPGMPAEAVLTNR